MIGVIDLPRRAALCAMGAAAAWGVSLTLSYKALEAMPPAPLLVLQLAASIAFLQAERWTRSLRAKGARPPWRAVAGGLLEPGLSYFLVLLGLSAAGASVASVIGATEPLFVLMLAAALGLTRPNRRVWILAVTAFIGVIFISLNAQDATGGLSWDALWGAGLILAGTAVAALYVALSEGWTRQFDPVVLLMRQQGVALVAALAMALALIPFQDNGPWWDAMTAETWIIAMASGGVQYAISFRLFLAALPALGAARTGFYLNLIPIFGVASAVIFLGERLTVLQALGAVLVIAALAGLRRT